MKIPDKVKIGGLTYDVEIIDTPLTPKNQGEIDYHNLQIKLLSIKPKIMQRTFLHEVLHGIFDNLGYYDVDEKKVDELTGALYALIVDNPGLFGGDKGAK